VVQAVADAVEAECAARRRELSAAVATEAEARKVRSVRLVCMKSSERWPKECSRLSVRLTTASTVVDACERVGRR
jgi:hypothetical protein